jgi:parallel beta-helix repeat protein
MKLRRVAIHSSILLCFSTAPAIARTLVVDDDGAECPQAEYITIQQTVAPNPNGAEAGDKILVCPGLYHGTVVVGTSDLRIEAQAGPGEVVLQGTGAEGELGFQLLNTTGVVLQGFTVQGFGRANIRIDGGSGNTVRKNVTRDAVVNDGIQVANSSANVVEHNTSDGNKLDGIFVGHIADVDFPPASDNIIRHNEIFNNGQSGINLAQSGPGNLVVGNRVYRNNRGLQNLLLSHGNVIEHNHFFENGGVGIVVANSNGVTVGHNRSEGNGGNGITLTNTATGAEVTNNRSERNLNGVLLNGAGDNLVEKNQVTGNVEDGIRLMNNSDKNSIRQNHVRTSGRDGIRVVGTAPEGNTIERNHIRESVEHDAHDDSVGTGTDGTANFWIDNHCETESPLGLCDH